MRSIFKHIPPLCRGDQALIQSWMEKSPTFMLGITLPLIFLGCGSYGLSMGLWQGSQMAVYAGVKFPLVVIVTLLINAIINSMFAMVLGSGITVRQSLQFLFTAFAICALILGAVSPITIGMALQGPVTSGADAQFFHSVILITHVSMITYAGIVSHAMLLGALRNYALNRQAAIKTFIAWLVGNLFVGAQVGWISRPFFGSPGSPVEFLRDNKFDSSFYEAVWRSILRFF